MRVGVLTGGGDCPGLNAVIRGVVRKGVQEYGHDFVGFRDGWRGPLEGDTVRLDIPAVRGILPRGGTILGSSRTNPLKLENGIRRIKENLAKQEVEALVAIGGEDTLGVAARLTDEYGVPVIGVPKTIDNDIHFIDRSFGFESAFAAAVDVIRSAHVEASGAKNGIGLVKLMGRHSGFIACSAALASADVDVVLIPEVHAELDGPCGLLAHLERRLARHGNAVVVVAEGALQEHCASSAEPMATDLSGNVKLKDIGLVLRDRINAHFRARGVDATLKYLDPSYHIRSVPASPSDSVFCWNMARNAVHAAMAGNTEMLIGRWHGRFVHVPMPLAVRMRKQVEPTDDLWMAVVEATGQPLTFY
jgi:6-phosphofructokinase 1